MILAIDIGNSTINIGCVEENRVLFTESISTRPEKTILECAVDLKQTLSFRNISPQEPEGAIISSVVPHLSSVWKQAVEKLTGKEPLLVGPGIKNGLSIRIDNPAQLGSDMVAASVASLHQYPVPQIIISMGTATTLSAIDRNRNFLGGAIVPGTLLGLSALSRSTSQLPDIPLEAPKHAIGTNTVDSMKSGAVFATASMLDGMIERIRGELEAPCAAVIATGELAPFIIPYCRTDILCDPDLIMKGLYLIFRKNRPAG